MRDDLPNQLPDLPRIDLDGFAPPWGCSEYTWGASVPMPNQPANVVWSSEVWKEHRYHMEVLAWFHHDYLGSHIYAQMWDYGCQSDPHQRWQYVLFLHRPTRHWEDGAIVRTDWAWAIAKEYAAVAGEDGKWDWRSSVPSYADVGRDVDQWVTCPEPLRFLIQGDS